MKKIGFMVQVLTLIAALPLLSILEVNHVTVKAPAKNSNTYVSLPAAKHGASYRSPSIGKLPS